VVNDDLFDYPSSPALIALRRFVSGTLRPVGLGLMSLILILNIAGRTPVANTFTPQDIPVTTHSLTSSLVSSLGKPSAKVKPQIPSTAATLSPLSATATTVQQSSASTTLPLRPHRLLHSKMTAHRLTSARLSVPPA